MLIDSRLGGLGALAVGADTKEHQVIAIRLEIEFLKDLIEHALQDSVFDLLLFAAATSDQMMVRVRFGDFIGGFA